MRIAIFGTLPSMLFKFHGHLIRSLRAEGHEVHLFADRLCADAEYAPRLLALGAQLHDVPVNRTGLNPFADLPTVARLVKEFRRVRPDVLLAYTVKPVIYGLLAARLASVGRRVGLIVGLGYAFTETTSPSLRRSAIRKVVVSLYRLALRQASLVLFQNGDDRSVFLKEGVIAKDAASGVVDGCGVDTEHFGQIALPDTAQFVFIGRLLADKGVRELVAAMREVKATHPAARLLLLGDLDENPSGIARDEVEGWIRQGLVEWLGFCDDIRPVLARASVFVLPSYREGLPQSGIEALSMGLPIITTDVPGCREIVTDGVNGLLVPPRDASGLAAAMIRLASDGTLRAAMGKASRDLAEKRFAASRISAQLVSLLTAGKPGE